MEEEEAKELDLTRLPSYLGTTSPSRSTIARATEGVWMSWEVEEGGTKKCN